MKRPGIRELQLIVEPHIPPPGRHQSGQYSGSQQAQQTNVMMGGQGGSEAEAVEGATTIQPSARVRPDYQHHPRRGPASTPAKWSASSTPPRSAMSFEAQQIRYLQAKSWVEQAKSILDVNEISLREYQEGIYPKTLN